MSRIVIPGGSGFLGRALAARLVERGDEVVILTRGAGQHVAGTRTVEWDAESIGPWVEALDGADAIVHLNGRRVDVRGTRRNIDSLISSRVQPVRVVGEAIARCSTPPPVWVQSSSLGVFGDGGDTVLDEYSTPTGIGPREMVTVCLAWEGAFHQAAASVERTVLLRMGIGVGGSGDPATAKLAQLVRAGRSSRTRWQLATLWRQAVRSECVRGERRRVRRERRPGASSAAPGRAGFSDHCRARLGGVLDRTRRVPPPAAGPRRRGRRLVHPGACRVDDRGVVVRAPPASRRRRGWAHRPHCRADGRRAAAALALEQR